MDVCCSFCVICQRTLFPNLYWDFIGWACNTVPGPQDAQRRVVIIEIMMLATVPTNSVHVCPSGHRRVVDSTLRFCRISQCFDMDSSPWHTANHWPPWWQQPTAFHFLVGYAGEICTSWHLDNQFNTLQTTIHQLHDNFFALDTKFTMLQVQFNGFHSIGHKGNSQWKLYFYYSSSSFNNA